MTQLQYLALGLGLVWILLALYIVGLHRRLKRLQREIDEIRRWAEDKRQPSGSARPAEQDNSSTR